MVFRRKLATWTEDVEAYHYEFELTADANIQELDMLCLADVRAFASKYGHPNYSRAIVWTQVAEDYDGIYFKHCNPMYHRALGALYENEEFSWWTHSMDVDSWCIFKPTKCLIASLGLASLYE